MNAGDVRRNSLNNIGGEQMTTLFISHSSKDKFFVRNLAERLVAEGIKVWIDEAEIKIGDSLIQKISEGIKDSDYLVVVLSQSSINSNWVQKELQMAMTREIIGNRVILPILIEKCEIPIFLRDKLYADFTHPDMFEKSFNKLLSSVGIIKEKELVSRLVSPKVEPKEKSPLTRTDRTYLKQVAQSALESFNDLNIVDVDKDRTYQPNREYALYNIYFKLTSTPSREWVQIFEAERAFPRHSMWRKAWIEGAYVVVNCGLDEVKRYHMKDITEDVASTNNKYREYLRQQEIRKQREKEKAEQEKRKLDNALDDLF